MKSLHTLYDCRRLTGKRPKSPDKNSNLSSLFLLSYHTQTQQEKRKQKAKSKKEARQIPSLPSTSPAACHGAAAPEMENGGGDCVCVEWMVPPLLFFICRLFCSSFIYFIFFLKKWEHSRVRRGMKYFKWFANAFGHLTPPFTFYTLSYFLFPNY